MLSRGGSYESGDFHTIESQIATHVYLLTLEGELVPQVIREIEPEWYAISVFFYFFTNLKIFGPQKIFRPSGGFTPKNTPKNFPPFGRIFHPKTTYKQFIVMNNIE